MGTSLGGKTFFGGDPLGEPPKNPFKSRITGAISISYRKFVTGATPETTTSQVSGFRVRQVTQSYGHPYRLLGRVNANIGGTFNSWKSELLTNGASYDLRRVYGGSPDSVREWEGRLYAAQPVCAFFQQEETSTEGETERVTAAVPASTSVNLSALGATAVSRVAPTNPLVDLSQSLAELYREGIRSPLSPGANPGGHYLNWMFGYLPLYSDVKDTVLVARRADELLRQYERDSGRMIRRRYRFPDETSTETTVESNKVPGLPAGGLSPSGALVGLGKLTTTKQTRSKTWFAGAFTYHLPKSGWRQTVSELDRLYGIVPGIDTAYELTPFSWLVDYFSNVGDVMQNISSFTQDGLVMPYGYIMRSDFMTIRYSWTGPIYQDGDWRTVTIEDVVKHSVKRRRQANPFGFGVDGALTARQQSILLGLGISLLPYS